MIGYVLKMYPRFSETFILGEVLELEARGRDLCLISLRKPDDGRFHEDLARVRSGVRYVPEHFPAHPILYVDSHLRALGRRPGAYVRVLLVALSHLPGSWKGFLRAPLVARAAAAAGCTRLHAHFASIPAVAAMFAARLAGIPFTFTAHAKDIYLHRRSRPLLRALIHEAERVVTVSDFNERTLRGIAGPASPPDRIVRIYNGVDIERFAPPRLDRTDGPPLILALGRLVEKKGFADLVDACAIMRARGRVFRCSIVGKGPLRGDLSRRVAAHGLGALVRLEGPLPQGEVARAVGRAAVLAVPCVVGRDGNRDGLPHVILEAMACGVPVVATRVTGIPEAVLDGVTGRLVQPGEPAALADALEDLIADRDRLRLMGGSARARAVMLFDRRANVALLEEVLSGRMPRVGLQPARGKQDAEASPPPPAAAFRERAPRAARTHRQEGP